jgi:hypothetical protein
MPDSKWEVHFKLIKHKSRDSLAMRFIIDCPWLPGRYDIKSVTTTILSFINGPGEA